MRLCVCFSADSPVLWLRVDPDMTTLRQVTLEQPDYMWQYMLKYERDVVAQSEVMTHILLKLTSYSNILYHIVSTINRVSISQVV